MSKQHKIEIDGKEMVVTESLYFALQHLRHAHEGRILWIDAICIDQKNNDERMHQVRQMGSIYKKAERVIVWLGAATPETDSLLQLMQRLERESYKYPCNSWTASDARWQELWLALGHEHKRYIALQRDGLRTLLSRPWFQRVWIIQEIANSRSAKVVCGAESVSARIFAIMPSLMNVNPNSQSQSILDIMPGPSRNHSWWIQNRDLNTLMSRFQGSRASDSRDIIYALLGMASDGYKNKTLVPDYTKSLPEVIQDTVAFLLDFPEQWRSDLSGKHALALPEWTLSELYRYLPSLAKEVLIWSVTGNHLTTVERLISCDDVGAILHDERGQELLWMAAHNGHTPVFKFLLDKGEEVDLKKENDLEALCKARENSDKQIPDLSLPCCTEISRKDGRYDRLLHKLAYRGDIDFVKPLIDIGIDVNATKGEYGHVVQAASAGGHVSMVKLLLKKSADTKKEDRSQRKSLSWAISRRNETLVKLLLSTNTSNINHESRGSTPLSDAIASGDESILELLLAIHGIDVNLPTKAGKRPLEQAVESGNDSIVKLLLATNGIDVNLPGLNRATPLFRAVQRGNTAITKLLLSVDGVDVNFPNSEQRTPLLLAVQYRQKAIVKLLLDTDGLDAERPDQYGMTPLSEAAMSFAPSILELMRNLGKAYFQPQSVLEATDLRLRENHVLEARLRDRDGRWQHAEICLDRGITDSDGSLKWKCEVLVAGIRKVTRNINLKVEIDRILLIAHSRIRKRRYRNSELNLCERLFNNDGRFVYVSPEDERSEDK